MAFILTRSTSADATSTEASQSRLWSDQNTIAKKSRGLFLARSLGMDQYQLPSVILLAMAAAIGGAVPNHFTKSPVTFASKMVTTENSLGLRALRLPTSAGRRAPKSSCSRSPSGFPPPHKAQPAKIGASWGQVSFGLFPWQFSSPSATAAPSGERSAPATKCLAINWPRSYIYINIIHLMECRQTARGSLVRVFHER
jgi:hypothetical protein